MLKKLHFWNGVPARRKIGKTGFVYCLVQLCIFLVGRGPEVTSTKTYVKKVYFTTRRSTTSDSLLKLKHWVDALKLKCTSISTSLRNWFLWALIWISYWRKLSILNTIDIDAVDECTRLFQICSTCPSQKCFCRNINSFGLVKYNWCTDSRKERLQKPEFWEFNL